MISRHYVVYVIGTFLCFPIHCIHTVIEEDIKPAFKRKFNRRPQPKFSDGKTQKLTSQKGVKRVCGQSQKSIRFDHTHKPQKVVD